MAWIGQYTQARWALYVRRLDVRPAATLGLVVLGPMLVLATFLAFGVSGAERSGNFLRVVLLADLVYVLVIAALIFRRIAALVTARRAQSAGARLHLRLTGAFALLALIPTVMVAVFAVLTINIGLEGWFSERVRSVVAASLSAAETYREDQRQALSDDALLFARFLELNAPDDPVSLHDDMRTLLTVGDDSVQRGLKESFLLDADAEIWQRGEFSYRFDFEPPSGLAIRDARNDGVAVIEDLSRDEYRALVPLNLTVPTDGAQPEFLYITRAVDGELLKLLDETEATARLYQQLEGVRGRWLFQFGLLYLGFALILILAAIWLGMIVAERLSRPIGRLAQASERVGEGDFAVRIKVGRGDDEIAQMGRSFNRMTEQLGRQRQALLDTNAQIETRRRLFDSVLSSVTSGVLGLDPDGQVAFCNRAASEALGQDIVDRALSDSVPEFSGLFEKLTQSGASVTQEEIKIRRSGHAETLLVRMAERTGEDGQLEGFVVAFDDVSELVAAQRLAAWGDVARRIAHEIKNPLTPIRLSAERIKRKYTPKDDQQAAQKLDELTAVIVRQTEDLRRIVDEFSKFARMPRPKQSIEDLCGVVRDAVTLQEVAHPGTELSLNLPTEPVFVLIDSSLIGQALTNLIANAAEAIESRRAQGWNGAGKIKVNLSQNDGDAIVTVTDNGIGLPDDPTPLLEPYVTTREKGTGLGLAIVNKIITEQWGRFQLRAANRDNEGHQGAEAVVTLPELDAAEQPNDKV